MSKYDENSDTAWAQDFTSSGIPVQPPLTPEQQEKCETVKALRKKCNQLDLPRQSFGSIPVQNIDECLPKTPSRELTDAALELSTQCVELVQVLKSETPSESDKLKKLRKCFIAIIQIGLSAELPLSTLVTINVNKLAARYPALTFETSKSINRVDDDTEPELDAVTMLLTDFGITSLQDMTLDMYQQFTAKLAADSSLNVLCLGLVGESGEVCDYLKKVYGHGHEFNSDTIAREIGDTLWYLSNLCRINQTSLGRILG